LQRLATTEAPAVKQMGAMCYEMAALPKTQVTYVCPRDGARVVYSSDEELGRLAKSMQALRNRVKALRERGLEVTLDESALCPKCARPGQPAQVDLLVRFAGESEPHRHGGVSGEDLVVLEELLAGKLLHQADGPDPEPLRTFLPQLRNLLGIPEVPDRAALAQRLRALPATPPAPLRSPPTGAECYQPAALPQTADYFCPRDGHRTHYERGPQSSLITVELPALRAIASALRPHGIVLDESELCRKCRPDVRSPSLVLIARFRDGGEVRTRDPSRADLVLLQEFFAGKVVHDGGMAGESLLRKHGDRLRALLGLPGESTTGSKPRRP
jgi:hypothetical protein